MESMDTMNDPGKETERTAQDPSNAPSNGPDEGFSGRRLWKEWIWPLIIVLSVMVSFRSTFADWNDVPTPSMKPNIIEGDRIFVNKVAYDLKVPFTLFRLAEWADPKAGDIVVLYSPRDGKRLVKRVVGVPGDELRMDRKRLYINGEPVPYGREVGEAADVLPADERNRFLLAEEDLGDGGHTVMMSFLPGRYDSFEAITVPEDQYFVMGDNRSMSLDSREFGSVQRKNIVGEATAVVLSMDPERWRMPRKGRFFQSLE